MLSFDSANSPALDILENMDVGVLVYDANGDLLFANELAQQLLGMSLDQLHAMQGPGSLWSLVDAGGALVPPEALPLNRVLATGHAVTRQIFGLAAQPRDGRIWFSVSAKPVRDAQGTVSQIVVTLVETTERKLAEERSEASRKQLQSALASMTDAVFIMTADGKLLEANEGCTRFYRLRDRHQMPTSLADFRAFMELMYPDGTPVPPEQWPMPRALRGEVSTNTKFTLRRRDTGEQWAASYSFAPIRGDSGEITGAVLVARDITEFRKREAALRAAEVQSSAIRRTLESALASMTDALYILGANGDVVEFNDAFVPFFRFATREECPLNAGAYSDILEMYADTGELVAADKRVAVSALRGEIATNRELTLRRHDTGEEWVASYGYSPIRNAEGVITGAVVVARDVTENRRKEQALMAAEADSRAVRPRLESALANMTDALVVTDAEGNFLEFNEAFVRYLKAPRREECLTRIQDYAEEIEVFFPSGEVAPVEAWSLWRALRGETVTNAEFLLRRRNTGETWIGSYTAAPIRNQDGSIEGAVVVVRDVTVARLKEQAVTAAEAESHTIRLRLESALANMSDALVVTDIEGNFLELNDAYVRYLGASSREECLKGITDYPANIEVFFPSGEVAPVHDWPVSRALRGESVINAEFILRRRDTGFTWIGSYNSAPIRNRDGKIEGAVSIARDVTSQKEAEQLLRESESRFRELINSAPEGVVVHRDGVVMFVNPAMVKLLGGQQAAEMVGNSIFDYVAPDYHQVVRGRIEEQLRTGKPTSSLELEYLRIDGSRVAVEVSGVPLEFDGERAHVVFVRDITMRRQAAIEKAKLEHELRQMQKLESIGRLAGGVAHDFNNILMVQKGYCELIQMQISEDDPIQNGLVQIEACADRAASLTRQLLAFSRKQVIDPVVLDMNALVETLATMLRRVIGEDIVMNVTPSPGQALVRADPGQMEQVLVNLAVNARDAMANGGRLTIDIAPFDVSPEYASSHIGLPVGESIRICVCDTGCGMDEETRNQIFEPFFTTKPVGTGTGLGLSTVHGIILQSGGSISVYSEPGTGTSFRIFLPRVTGQAETAAVQPGVASAGVGEQVLVVEDDAALRTLMELMLGGLGYRVVIAGDGDEAVRMVKAEGLRPDIVLTDVVMPGMNGRVLVEHLRLVMPALPVIFMSGYTHDIIVHHGVPEDGLDFIQKPFTVTAIAEKLRKVLARRG